MHRVRLSVRENVLSDPSRVQPEHYQAILSSSGRGWVYEENGKLLGFAMADTRNRSIWALFVRPDCEGRGIGRALHDTMMQWLFAVDDSPVWLVTRPGTRAERFYLAAGWKQTGTEQSGEVRLELRPAN